VGTFLPPPDDPANALLAYYSDLNQRAYRPAYGMLTGQKPAYKAFAAGYRNTAHVTINVVATPLYRTRRHGLAYTCVGIRFTALSTAGRGTGYGGWYLVATRGQMDFSIVPARSAIHVNGGLVLPTGAACAGTVP
jgi:hypothetical protein